MTVPVPWRAWERQWTVQRTVWRHPPPTRKVTTGMPQMTLEYNVENRLVRATHQTNGIDDYVYDPVGQRVMKNGVITLYGIDGKRLGMYTVRIMPNSDLFAFQTVLYGGQNPPQNVWFAGRSVGRRTE